MKRKILTAGLVLSISLLILVGFSSKPVRAHSTFVLSSWDFPDSYGQGLTTVYLQTNTSGTWSSVEGFGYLEPDPSPIDWNVSDPVRVLTWVSMNYTLTGASSLENGKNYIRQTLNVTDSSDTLLFTEVNGTYVQGLENEGLYWYQYGFVWDFLPVSGEVYTVNIYYEVYY